ncbi:MAG: PorV/PorQ family protein [Bacteroidales bacterium]|nr:PorV/PorQ family protein [Bacteroidales bacterium]
MINRILTFIFLLVVAYLYSGNEQRAGQAGASELLINPWARSSGWGSANTAGIKGVEAFNLNIAGTAFIKKTELMFAYTNWLVGSEIYITSFGFTQKVGETGALSMMLMNMDFGNIEITTYDMPEGGLGTFHPTYTIIGLAYAKEFSNSIYGGLAVKVVNEKIPDLSATGVCLDAGIQYLTGLGKDKTGKKIRDNLHFGISMKNIGTPMRYRGDGLSFRGLVPPNDIIMTVEQRSAEFELPALITLGAMFDFYPASKLDSTGTKVYRMHRLSIAGNFTSNSFTKDQFHAGLEYSFKEIIMVRGGFIYEKGIFEYETRTTAFTGPTLGATVQIPLNKEKNSVFAFDYSYRFTNPFNGVHTIGVKVTL